MVSLPRSLGVAAAYLVGEAKLYHGKVVGVRLLQREKVVVDGVRNGETLLAIP